MSKEELIADIVVAGGKPSAGNDTRAEDAGGTAGCVVAGRLSDAFPELSIIIIENGPESKDNPLVDRELDSVGVRGAHCQDLYPVSSRCISSQRLVCCSEQV